MVPRQRGNDVSSSPRIVVIGAGINGRMVQHLIPSAQILDWGPTPADVPRPRFFGANYLWAPIPGLPCKQMAVITTIDDEAATPSAIRAYKARIGKEHEVVTEADVLAVARMQFPYHSVGYELQQFPVAFIRYNCHVARVDLEHHYLLTRTGERIDYDYLVPTIPLPAMLAMADIRVHGLFRNQPVRVRVLRSGLLVHDGALYVDYVTDTTVPEYRRTTRYGERHDETLEHKFPGDEGEFHRLVPGKIWDCPRSPEFLDQLAEHHVFPFGRYGSWDSDELVHMTLRRVATWALHQGLEVSDHARSVA